MGRSRTSKGTASYLAQWESDSAAWLGQLDAKSDQILRAIMELGETYQYASLRFSAAVDFAQQLQELEPQRMGANSSALFDRSCQEYGHNIEELLDGLAAALRESITQDAFDNYLQPVIADIEPPYNGLLD